MKEGEAAVFNTSAGENQYSKDYLHKEIKSVDIMKGTFKLVE
jgi:hypothetical protein